MNPLRLWKNILRLPTVVVILGLVSFFNDIASEMIYPIVPIFLVSVLHTSVPIIGIIEGIAEATASITKFFFGTYSDYLRARKPFVVLGYSFGSISKILIGLAGSWPLVLGARFIDRTGKGLRTAPRDSLLLENTTTGNKGFVFGFHRAFDSLGAVVGPLCALLCLYFFKDNIRLTFFIAFIPSVIAVLLLLFLVKDKKSHFVSEKRSFVRLSWRKLSSRLVFFLLVSFIFSLGNSSDTFLLLYARSLGLTTVLVVLVYVLYNLSQTVFATPFGRLSDIIGAKRVFTLGLFVFSAVYFFFGITHSSVWLWLLFPVYGVYIAATDGVSKAYIAEFITKEESGTYFGAFYTLTALGNFLASFIGGILWFVINPSATFFYGSIMAATAGVLLLGFRRTMFSSK